tara:strand:+ start:6111 stop:6476 length:366 start_codon:yes stop_codon:yes gene_type:complete
MNRIFVLISLIFLLASCKHDSLIEISPEIIVACDSTVVSFSATIAPILNASCVSCHKGSNAAGSIWLDNYTDVKLVAIDNSLLGSIKHLYGFAAMPQGALKLDDCKIAKIENWISEGMLNN